MARPGLKFDILATPKPVKVKTEAMGEHACVVCGARASFGTGRRVEEADWHCFAHWPDRPAEKARAA